MAKVPLAKNDDMVDALSAHGADEPFDIGILPGRARRCRSICASASLAARFLASRETAFGAEEKSLKDLEAAATISSVTEPDKSAREQLNTVGIATRTRRFRTVAVILLVVAGCVNYIDRSAVSVGNPEIRSALGLSYRQMGLLLSAFAWSYGFAQIPAGVAVDRFGPRRALGLGLVLWSLAQGAAGFVGSLGQFVAARVALGLGESPMYIGGTRVCANWFSAKDRALPISIFNSSSALAPALAPPLLTVLMVEFGWRWMFLFAALAGFAVAIFWFVLYRDPIDAGIPPADIVEIQK
jgi:sugar phosphate permease